MATADIGRVGAAHTGDSQSNTGNLITYDLPGYTTYDASPGVSKDARTAQLFVQNLTSVNASVSSTGGQFVQAEVVARSHIAGVKFSYQF